MTVGTQAVTVMHQTTFDMPAAANDEGEGVIGNSQGSMPLGDEHDKGGTVKPLKARADRGKHRDLDQFYTKPEVAKQCMALVERTIAIDVAQWFEPSAGKGAFLDLMPTATRLGIDIDPPVARDDIQRHNFLTWNKTANPKNTVVVGNPPFGRNASLALQFINHAAGFAEYVCFILPRTFEKKSTQNKVSKLLEYVDGFTLGEMAFTHGVDDADYDVPCCFQIWRRVPENNKRKPHVRRLKHGDFKIVPDHDKADFAFQRVGARAGHVSTEGLGKSWKSHYFIKANIPAKILEERLNSIKWEDIRARTAGNPSIGKAELIEEYEAELARRKIKPSVDPNEGRLL